MLAQRAAQYDIRAYHRLVRSNLRLVVSVARGYVGNGVGLRELIETGISGLVRAVETFEATMTKRFATHAERWIRHPIAMSVGYDVAIQTLAQDDLFSDLNLPDGAVEHEKESSVVSPPAGAWDHDLIGTDYERMKATLRAIWSGELANRRPFDAPEDW